MKSTGFYLLVTAVGLATSGLQAGETYEASSKNPKNPPPIVVPDLCDCFDAGSAQMSIYGAGILWNGGNEDDALGGGLSFGYFFTENIGVEADATWLATGSEIHHFTGSVVFRFPIKPACIAPYVYGGGGVLADSSSEASFHAGAGIDIRFGKSAWCPGIFADARYTWTDYEDGTDFTLIRAGFRFNL